MSDNNLLFDGQRSSFAPFDTRVPDRDCLFGREREVRSLLEANPYLEVSICRSAYSANLYIRDPRNNNLLFEAWYKLEWEPAFRELIREIRQKVKAFYEPEARY